MKNMGLKTLALGVGFAVGLGACGDVPDAPEEVDTVVRDQVSLENILVEVSDMCAMSATDVNTIVCQLHSQGQPAGKLSFGCWSNRGEWGITGIELASYDVSNLDEVCRAE